MDKMDKAIMGGILGIMMIMIMASFVQASTPQLPYECPVCGERFATYEELLAHFTSEHPSEPIDIIWE